MNAVDTLAQRAYEHAPRNRRVKAGFQTPLANTMHEYELEIEYLDHLLAEDKQRMADAEDQAAKGLIPR